MRGYGTRFVWNSFRSTLRAPSKRRDEVMDETTCAIKRLRCSKLGRGMSRFRRQISYTASLSTRNVQSEFSIVLWVDRTAL